MEYEINGKTYKLDQTCSACPEQYDAYLDGKIVGYFRLRNGLFRVQTVPDFISVYECHTRGDGIFHEHEREFFLVEGIKAIDIELNKS